MLQKHLVEMHLVTFFEFTFYYIKILKHLNIEETIFRRLGDNLFIDNRETREIVQQKGLLEKWDARNKAYGRSIRKIRNIGHILD